MNHSFKTDKNTTFKRTLKKYLFFEKALSCNDLSILTKKSLPYTTKYVNDLLAEGSIVETGYALSTGGRRPQMYSLKPDLNYIIAVSMDQRITKIGLVDMQQNIIGKVLKLELDLHKHPNALPFLSSSINSFINTAIIDPERVIGIGISMPGFVDAKKGLNHSFLHSKSQTIVSYIESETGIPVLIDNDSSLVGLAELRIGTAHNRKNAMVINITWGVGLGLILNGELFRGYNGFAGEFSHIPVFKNNKICSCGKTGCLETETSLLVIVEKAIFGLKNGSISVLKNLSTRHIEESCQAIMDAANKGDTFAVALLSEAAYNLGLGIAILIHLLNPELIVLSGRGSESGKFWLAPIQQAINEHCIPKIAEDTRVVISNMGNSVYLIGAAALVMENYEVLKNNVKAKVLK